MKNKLYRFKNIIVVITILVALAITAQSILLGEKTFGDSSEVYTHYNNYVIFKTSFYNLIEGNSLYDLYLSKQWDLYKYSPTFALIMVPFYLLPDAVGLFFWNLLNVLPLILGFLKVSNNNKDNLWIVLVAILIEAITALQNAQSNGLIAGMLIWAYIFLEEGKNTGAIVLIVATIFIKLFGGLAIILVLFYPNKLKTILQSIVVGLLLLLIPLPIIGWEEFLYQYQQWYLLLKNDHSISYGISVVGFLSNFFDVYDYKTHVLIIGLFLLVGSIIIAFKNELNSKTKLFVLASILIWVVIFNHKAESPTFIIAVLGCSLWYFISTKNTFNNTLYVLMIIFTVLSPTDIFPKFIRDAYIVPYYIKVFPCILIWITVSLKLSKIEPFKMLEKNEIIN